MSRRNDQMVEIISAVNGFIVRPGASRYSEASADTALVFQTFAELVSWLADQFSHRNGHVVPDIDDNSRPLTRAQR